jgi:hypothetical protein
VSLKNFHLLFIACSVLLALLFAVWAANGLRSGGSPLLAIAAAASLAFGALLVQYERRFLRRCHEMGIK